MVYLVRNPVPGIVPGTYEAFTMQFNQIMGKIVFLLVRKPMNTSY